MEPYAAHHLSKMKLKEVHSSEVGLDVPLNAFATTFFYGDDPVAIFGASQLFRGVFHVWAFLTEDVKKHPIAFHREVVKLIDWWFKNAQLRRMQMSVKVGFSEGSKWASLLGFVPEGVMKNYGPDGSDYLLFARIA